MKKIFIFSSLHNWDDVRIFQKQAKSLAKKYKVELHAVADFTNKEVDQVQIYGLSKPNKRYLRPINWIKLLYRGLKSDADVYHFHDPELLFVGYIIKKIKKKVVIYDAHENVRLTIMNREWIKNSVKKPLSKYFDLYEKKVSQKLDCAITVLDEIAVEFICKGVKTKVIKNYQIDVGVPKNNIVNDNKIKIVYAGSISSIRGIEELAGSFRFLPYDNLTLEIYGEFSSLDIKDKIMYYANSDKRIEYKGLVSYEYAQNKLKESDIGIVAYKPGPNHDFCLPNKIFEYMSAGVPIIATRINYWEENFKKYNNILFIDEISGESIAKAISYFIENKEEAQEMGQAGYRAYKKYFTWEGEEKKLFELYNELLNS